jgi:hypothetical protein
MLWKADSVSVTSAVIALLAINLDSMFCTVWSSVLLAVANELAIKSLTSSSFLSVAFFESLFFSVFSTSASRSIF